MNRFWRPLKKLACASFVFNDLENTMKKTISIFSALFLTACGFSNAPSSPDVVYSETSSEAKKLQVPPDLTNISNGEQFILPGTEAGSLTRNRLLPKFSSAEYVRRGDQNWLELQQNAETVWPIVLDFIRQQKMAVEKTEPTSGLIMTQWRTDDQKSGGILKNLISNDKIFARYAFRLERNGSGTRVFARSMQLAGDAINSGQGETWPASSHNPEEVSSVLTRLLVFLGAEEQRAKGILSDAQAKAVLDDAELQTTASGSQLVVHKGFAPSFNDIKTAVTALEYTIMQSDGSVGRLQVAKSASEEPILISLTPVHISAVRVAVSRPGGTQLEKAEELKILAALREQIV